MPGGAYYLAANAAILESGVGAVVEIAALVVYNLPRPLEKDRFT